MLWKCCTQYASKFGKLNSGHRTGKGQFSFQSQERQCQRMLKLSHNWTHLTCQCSCLENPRDEGAWWAAVYGVAPSRTWLKRLSSSNSRAFFGIAFLWDWNENWFFQSCGHWWVFQICWHIECSTFTASSFRIWNSSAGITSPPLALFIVMLPRAHLTSRMSGSRWVIKPSWLSGSVRSFCIVILSILVTS